MRRYQAARDSIGELQKIRQDYCVMGDTFSTNSKLECVYSLHHRYLENAYNRSVVRLKHSRLSKTPTTSTHFIIQNELRKRCVANSRCHTRLKHVHVDQFAGSMGSGGNNYNRRDGFNDNEPRVESYGSGPGSGAYDLANTGLGGYGNNKGGPTGHMTSTGLSGAGSSLAQDDENSERREGFAGGEGEGRSGGTYGAGPGASASDPANTGLGGYSPDEATGQPDQNNSAPGEDRYGSNDLGEQLNRAHQEGQRMKQEGGGFGTDKTGRTETEEGHSSGERLLGKLQ